MSLHLDDVVFDANDQLGRIGRVERVGRAYDWCDIGVRWLDTGEREDVREGDLGVVWTRRQCQGATDAQLFEAWRTVCAEG